MYLMSVQCWNKVIIKATGRIVERMTVILMTTVEEAIP